MCGLSLDWQQSSKLVLVGQKQREQLRTLNASQMNNSMRDSMHASAVHAVFGPPLQILSFITNRAHQYVYISILWSSTSRFFQ